MSLRRYMNTFWEHRYTALIWWIAVRYIVIGLEYIFSDPHSEMYWIFGGISQTYVGMWMFVVGLLGIHSRFLCWQIWNNKAGWCTMAFALGVAAHSMFRITVLSSAGLIGDPLIVLFICDAAAMFWVMVQLLVHFTRKRTCH